MAALAREGVARGAVRIDWSVLDWNVNAMRFYRRLGAAPQRDWVRYELDEEAMKRLARAQALAPSTRLALPRDP
jgi:hypothetical protein